MDEWDRTVPDVDGEEKVVSDNHRSMGESDNTNNFHGIGQSRKADANYRTIGDKGKGDKYQAIGQPRDNKKSDKTESEQEKASSNKPSPNRQVGEDGSVWEFADNKWTQTKAADEKTSSEKMVDANRAKEADRFNRSGIGEKPVQRAGSVIPPDGKGVVATPYGEHSRTTVVPASVSSDEPAEDSVVFHGVWLATRFFSTNEEDEDMYAYITPAGDADTHLNIDMIALTVGYGLKADAATWWIRSIRISHLSGIIIIPLVPAYAEPV